MVAEATARRRTFGFLPMSTIFAMAGGQGALRYFIMRSLSRQPRECGVRSTPRHARAQACCQVVASDRRRVIYDARAFREPRADGMRVHEGMGRVTALRPPGNRSSRRAIATCATRHAKETRRGET